MHSARTGRAAVAEVAPTGHSSGLAASVAGDRLARLLVFMTLGRSASSSGQTVRPAVRSWPNIEVRERPLF